MRCCAAGLIGLLRMSGDPSSKLDGDVDLRVSVESRRFDKSST